MNHDDKKQNELTQRALANIAASEDPLALERIYRNAMTQNNEEVARAAQRKLYSILPSAEPGSLEHDVWQSIYALEGALTEERGKTTRLSRTRQKITRDGETITVADLVMKPASEGYRMLLDRDMHELTFESVALRHAAVFPAEVLEKATQRLTASGRL
jgi:hypothetical protein